MSAPTDPVTLSLARVEVKLDQLIEGSGDHERRIRKLEEQRAPSVDDRWIKLACVVLAAAGVGTAGMQQLLGG